MASSFEFLARDRRRLAMPRTLIGVVIASILLLGYVTWYLRGATQRAIEDVTVETRQLTELRQNLAASATAILPSPRLVDALQSDITRHNEAFNGPRTQWAKLLQRLKRVLPDQAVIVRCVNARTGTPVFGPDDLDVKLLLLVETMPLANDLYQRFSDDPAFKSLSFNPGEDQVFQRRKGVAVDVSFHFDGAVM